MKNIIKFEPEGPEQMTDLVLSQAIIRARNQINSIAPKLPDNGARFKANLKLMEDEQNRRNSIRVQNQNQNINSDELLSKINEGPPPPPPELVILPPRRRTNEHQHQQQSSFYPVEQMTDLALSEAIIRVRNQFKSIMSIAPRWLPDNGARFKAHLKLMEDEQNRRNSIRVQNQNQKHRKACGTLEASQSHDLSSKDENDVDIEMPQSTSPSTSRHSTSSEDSQEIDQINESLKVLAESLIARVEERKIRFEERKIRFEERKRKLEERNRKLEERNRKLEDKQKYTIGECMKIMDEMEPKIADDAYIRVLKMLQEKGWRVTFMFMSDKLRREWIGSI